MSPLTVLVVEDDDAIALGLARVLDGQGYLVRRLATGRPTLAEVEAGADIVVLDLGLPDIDGIEVCRQLRERHPALPILILSARDEELDVVGGLDAGADDYMIKPFRLAELLARIRALIRRGGEQEISDAPVQVGSLRIEPEARRAWRDGTELALRPREFDLLLLLARNAGRVLTRERIMEEVWDTTWMGSTKTLDMHVLALRRQVGAEAITTLRGVGYRLEAAR